VQKHFTFGPKAIPLQHVVAIVEACRQLQLQFSFSCSFSFSFSRCSQVSFPLSPPLCTPVSVCLSVCLCVLGSMFGYVCVTSLSVVGCRLSFVGCCVASAANAFSRCSNMNMSKTNLQFSVSMLSPNLSGQFSRQFSGQLRRRQLMQYSHYLLYFCWHYFCFILFNLIWF